MDKIRIEIPERRGMNWENCEISINGDPLTSVSSFTINQDVGKPTKVKLEFEEPDLELDFVSYVEKEQINWRDRYK